MVVKVKIREGKREDIEKLWRIEIQSIKYHTKITERKLSKLNKNKTDKKAEKNFIKEYEKLFENKKSVLLVAEENKKIIGYLTGEIIKWWWSDNPPKLALINDIGVIESHKKKGIAERLLKEFEKWTKPKKVYALSINVWAKNIPAYTFYKKHKFEDYNIYMIKKLK